MHNLPIVLTKNRTGNAMYKKRSGIKYVKTIIEIQNQLYALNMISIFRKWYHIFIRSLVTTYGKKVYLYKIIKKVGKNANRIDNHNE